MISSMCDTDKYNALKKEFDEITEKIAKKRKELECNVDFEDFEEDERIELEKWLDSKSQIRSFFHDGVENLDDELKQLVIEKKKILWDMRHLKTTHNVSDILDLFVLSKEMREDILNNVSKLEIYNQEGIKSHEFGIEYEYSGNKYLFHFGRRPDEYYHVYSIFVNDKIEYSPNIIKEFKDFAYESFDSDLYDEEYISIHILDLTDKKELWLGYALTCFYFLFDFYGPIHQKEYWRLLENGDIMKLFEIITTYYDDDPMNWYNDALQK